MSQPFFSVVVTTYDRARIVRRCVDSCLAQSFSDFEVVVVDDASTDDTVQVLNGIDDPRLGVVVHESNRGINPSRHTGVNNSRGEWIVVVDSDWELFPYTLERLRTIIQDLPEGVRIVRGRLLWDDGRVSPASVPTGPIGYEGHIRRMEQDWSDDVSCMHRSVFERTPYFSDRRGVIEALYELNLARVETGIFVDDVLGKEHTDAPNSWWRSVDASEVIPRLLREAPDMLWMVETTLDEHGAALVQHAPNSYREFLRMASTQAFLVGDRRKGRRYALAALRRKKLDPLAWVTLALGLLGPHAVARGSLAQRRLNRWRSRVA
ncbi:MAG: glycosyltransferase family 2 protein [Actinomycetota bacterium]